MIKKLIYILLILPVYLSGQNNFFWSHAGITVETNSLKDSVLAVWELDETEGTTAYDSYSDNDGTNTSATIDQTGVVSKAYDFNGTSAYLTMPPEQFRFNPLTESYSLSMWVKSANPSPTANVVYLISGGQAIPGTSYAFFALINTGSNDDINFNIKNQENTTSTAIIKGDSIWDNTWHLVTMTVNHSDSYLRAYLDGEIQDSASITFETYTVDDESVFYVSRRPVSADRFYDGLIDQLSVWGRALTEEDLTDLYNDGSGIAYTGWQGTGAQRYNSGSTWSITPLFTKTINFTPDAGNYSGSYSYGSSITEDDKYIFIVFNKDNYLNHVVYRINKSTGDTASQVIQTDNAYYGDHHKCPALLVADGCLLVAVEQLRGNGLLHNSPVEIFRWEDTDSLQNYTSTVVGNSTTERLSYPFLYEAGDSVVIEARRYGTTPPYRVYYTSSDTGQTFSSMTEYINYGDGDYWTYARHVGNNSKINPILGITPQNDEDNANCYQYITYLKSDFTGDFYSLDGDNLGTSVTGSELEEYNSWGDTIKNTKLRYVGYSKVFGSYIYGLGIIGTRTSSGTDVDSMQIFKVNNSTGAVTLGSAFSTSLDSTSMDYNIIFAYDGDIYTKLCRSGTIYYYKVKTDLSGMDLVATDGSSYHVNLITDLYSELSADYEPTTKQLRIYRFDDPDGL